MNRIHKKIILTILLAIFIVIMFGFVCPYLISIASDDAVILGVLTLIGAVYFIIWSLIKLWHRYN